MTAFLYGALQETDGYRPEVISLARSSHDEASVRIASPRTWGSGPKVVTRTARGIEHRHIGAWFSELEPFRYRPRALLDDVLSEFDFLQFVTGNPPWACVARNVDRPTFLWTATTLWEDRETRLSADQGAKALWRRAMTRRAQSYERRALEEVDGVFALSEYTCRNLRDQFSVDARIAPQGIDVDQFHPVDDPEEGYVLTVSRINDPRKRIPLLLRAYATAKQHSSSIPELYIVGDEPSDDLRRETAELGIAEDVRYLGTLPRPELIRLYQNALCFVLSSDEEGLGIVILEAMASGQPVISTRCGGPEMLVEEEETGLLTPVGDEEALAYGLLRLTNDSERRTGMGKKARERTERHFSIEAAKQPFLNVYENY